MSTRDEIVIVSVLLALVACLLVPQEAQAATRCFGEPPTITGTDQADDLGGTPGHDVIYAGPGADIVHGAGGNDLICGGGGPDLLYGDEGTDKLAGQKTDDGEYGGPGNDLILAGLGSEGFGSSMFGGRGDDRLIGGPFSDGLSGGPGDDYLNGREPAHVNPRISYPDTVDYRSALQGIHVDLRNEVARGQGRDTLRNVEDVIGSHFGDVLLGDRQRNLFSGDCTDRPSRCPRGDDVMWGRAGKDFLVGDRGRDRLHGGGGADAISPGLGADHGYGGDGHDLLEADYGKRDRLDGGAGADLLYVVNGPAQVDLAAGKVSTSTNTATLAHMNSVLGSDQSDILLGDHGRNVFQGSGGNDRLKGRAGDDELRGGARVDEANGGRGRDLCEAEQKTRCER